MKRNSGDFQIIFWTTLNASNQIISLKKFARMKLRNYERIMSIHAYIVSKLVENFFVHRQKRRTQEIKEAIQELANSRKESANMVAAATRDMATALIPVGGDSGMQAKMNSWEAKVDLILNRLKNLSSIMLLKYVLIWFLPTASVVKLLKNIAAHMIFADLTVLMLRMK